MGKNYGQRFPKAIRDHSFRKWQFSMSQHETFLEISVGSTCMTTPKITKPSKNANGVAKNLNKSTCNKPLTSLSPTFTLIFFSCNVKS